MELKKQTFTNGAIAAVSTSSLWLTPDFMGRLSISSEGQQ